MLSFVFTGESIDGNGVEDDAPRVEAHIESAAVGPIDDKTGRIVIA